MAGETARPGDWQTHPMPEARATLPVHRVFSADEMARLRKGQLPRAGAEWFIVWTGDALDFFRVRGRTHIYRLTFAPAPFGERVAALVVNRDPEEYSGRADDASFALYLCDKLLRRSPIPADRTEAPRITLALGDITETGCDVVVNAANAALAGGGGVDGAIHDAAGPALHEACAQFPMLERGVRCPTGEARVTPAFGLRGARWIVHAVGPIYRSAREDAPLLRSAFDQALDAAVLHGATTVAVPALSCGAYRYPLSEAAAIAIAAARTPRALHEIRFALFDQRTYAAWEKALTAPTAT